MKKTLLLLLLMLVTASTAWAVQTEPPEFQVTWDREAEIGIITATGNGHICLYLGVGEQLLAEGEGSASYVFPIYSENPMGDDLLFSATAQIEGEEASDYTLMTVSRSGRPEKIPVAAPEITYWEEEDHVYVTIYWPETDGYQVYTGEYEYLRPEYGQPDEYYEVEAYTEESETYKESEHTICEIYVPAKGDVSPYETPAPEMIIELTDEALVITATGEGIVTLYIQYIDNVTGEMTTETYTGEGTVSVPVARGYETTYINFWAVAQADEDALPGVTEVEYWVEVPALEGGDPDPDDPHMWGCWLVVDNNGSAEWYQLYQDSNGSYSTTVTLSSSGGNVENYYDYEWNDDDAFVYYHFVIEGVSYGPETDGSQTVLGNAMENPLYECDNNYCLEAGHSYTIGILQDYESVNYYVYAAQMGGSVGYPLELILSDKNGCGIYRGCGYLGGNGPQTAEVDIDQDLFGDQAYFYFHCGNGRSYGASYDGEPAVLEVPYAQEFTNSNYNFTVPSGYRYRLGWYKGYLYAKSLGALPTGSITVHLPAGVNVNDYTQMRLVLRYTVEYESKSIELTDATSYTFHNLDSSKTWSISLVNEYDDVFGVIDNIVVGDGNVDVTFNNLLKPNTVTLTVLSPDGVDVTDQTEIEWCNADGYYLTDGPSIGRLPAGKSLRYSISLSQSLTTYCVVPAETGYVVNDGDNNITFRLQPLGTIVLTGKVCDATTLQPIAGAMVSAIQTNGGYTNTITTTTDENGEYSIEAANIGTTIKVAARKYITRSLNYDSLTTMGSGTIRLADILMHSSVINVQFTYTPAHLASEAAEPQPGYDDFRNVDFKIRNNRTWREITDFTTALPQIFLEEEVEEGSVLQLTASSRKNAFMPVVTTVTLTDQEVVATINIVEFGKISATYSRTPNEEVVGALYDSNGKRVLTGTYVDKKLVIDDLPDGQYTLITMGKSDLFNKVYDLSILSSLGLKEGNDYLRNSVTVSSGIITVVSNTVVPAFDYTDFIGDNASFTVSPHEILTDNYLTFRAQIEFKEEYAAQVSDVGFYVILPKSCPMYPNSVMVGNKVTSNYYYSQTYSDNTLKIPMTNPNEIVKFCAIPSVEGNFSPNAYVYFKYNGNTIIQPIGCAEYVVERLTLRVPSITADPEITVSGTASKGKMVKVFEGEVQIAETQCLENGTWRVKARLNNPVNPSTHYIHAEITTEQGTVLKTEVANCVYDKNAIKVLKVTQYNEQRGPTPYLLSFDFINPESYSQHYSYDMYDNHRTFTYTINFENNHKVSNVVLYVKTALNHWWPVPATYNSVKNLWVAAGEFGNAHDADLPVHLAVCYDYRSSAEGEAQDLLSVVPPGILYPGPDMTFCIDPSGYVYEGVPSNRLQGVTATCYYKDAETGEPVLWDAEQYEQQNPLLTDERGNYRWDVPIGQWQVKYEKEGYETTFSDWLPVPPPQLDINIGMVQMREPEVIKAHAYPQAVELEFDKYMLPETLTTDNITVSVNGTPVSGTIELLNAEVDDPDAITSLRRSKGTGLTLASRVRFNADQPFNADKVTLRVKRDVESYAGVQMASDYVAVLPLELEMQQIVVDSVVVVPFMGDRLLNVAVQPGAAAAGKTLTVRSVAPMIAPTDAEQYTLDGNGRAVVTVHGDLPGMTSLLFSIDGYDLTASTLVEVSMEIDVTVATPTASIASGSEVEKGTEVYLFCTTPGATIYYTLDGSCPCDATEARMTYDGTPIIINSDVTIMAMAVCDGMYDSEVATFTYHVPSSVLRGDVNRDGSVNIADINLLIDYILRDRINSETLERGDVNGDGSINIADINAVIQIILSDKRVNAAAVTADQLHVEDVTLGPGEQCVVNVTLDHAADYSALQCDITLPQGLTLVDINGVSGHESSHGTMSDGVTRVLTYSPNKLSFDGNGLPVLTFTVRADAALASTSQITLSNVVLSDLDSKAWGADNCLAMVNNASGLRDLTATTARVWTEGRNVCIATEQPGQAHIVTMSGHEHSLSLTPGVTRHELEPGVYVIVVDGKSHKMLIRP